MIPTIPPFVPTMYGPNNRGRYRQYPRNVVTPIPGAGVDPGGKLVWAEQEIDLDGNTQPYGNYALAPLRGLGTIMWMGTGLTTEQRQAIANMSAVANPPLPDGGSVHVVDPDPEVDVEEWSEEEYGTSYADEIERRARAYLLEQDPGEAEEAITGEEGFFEKKIGPVPVWAAVGGGALVLVGGAALLFRRRRR